MAKSDKNRERDRELDTEIDMEEMDDLTLEDPWGGESSTDDPGGRRPANPSRRILTEGVKGMAEGAMATVGTELERNMPNLGVVASEVKGTYDDILEVKDEISRQLQPLTLSMEKTARKILPRAEKLLPKSWYSKIKKTLDRREDERRAAAGAPSRSVESERADLISSELASVFQQQLEMNQHNELEEKKRELMDRAVSSTQHRDDQHAYARIYDAVRSIELSHRTHMLAYMKKSLELKYKHLFVAQDTFNLLSRTASVYEGYLQGIVKNTSLPDVMKTNMSDYIRKSRTDKYGTMMADFMSNARQKFFNRIKQSIKDIGSNLQFAMSGAEQAMEGIDMANEMGEMTGDSQAGTAMAARMGGGLLGGILAAGPTRRLLQKFAPWTRTINGKLDNVKTRAYMGLDKKRAEWSASGNFFKELIADFLPSINTGVTGSNDLLSKGEDAAAFDKITRQSIVEIIPGYLGKIWHEIAMLRTGRDDIEEMGFNIHRRRFTTVGQIQEDIFNDERMFGGKGIQSQSVARALATVRRGIKRKSPDEDTENVLKGKEDIISKIIANHVQWREHFQPDVLSQFAAAPSSERFANNSYIKKISKGINFRDFVVVVRAISRGLTDKDGKLNTDLCRNFDNAILDAWQQADSYLKNTPYWTEAMGARRFLSDVDEVSVLEDVLDENGKVVGQAKKIIQRGRKGLIRDNNAINRDLVGDRMSRFEADDVARSIGGYDKDLTGFLSDLDYVRTRLHEMKDDIKKSGAYKSAVDFWTAASSPFKTPGVPTPGAPGAKPGAEGSADFVGPLPFDKLSKRQQVEFLLRKGDWKGAAAAGVTGVAGAAVDIAKKTGTAVNNVSGVAATKAGVKGDLKKWASDTWNWVDKKLDSLPQSPEEVEACIDNLGDQCASLWKKTPKDRKAAMKRLRQLEKKLRKRFPKQAAFIDAKIKQMEEYEKAIEESRVGKFVAATGKYAKKKADPHLQKASDAISSAVDAAKKKAKEVEQAALKKIAKETGIPAKTLAKALRGDKKAIARVKKAAPKVWERIKEEQFSDEAIERRKEAIIQGAKDLKTSIHESIKEGAKGAGSIFASAKDTASEYGAAFREGAGIKDKVEGVEADIPDATLNPDKPKDIVNDELMKLLGEWRDSVTTEHTKITELVAAIGQQLADGITVNGIGGGGGGGTIERKRYGLFGKAGDLTKRGLKGIGGTLWSGAKKVGGLYTTIYGSLWRGASNVAGSVYRGAANAARFVTSEIGVTPYLDLYVKGQEGSAPILTWRKQAYGKGVVFVNDDGSFGDRVKTTKEIIKSKKQVADPETGNILVTYEDHEKGLWCRASGLSTISRMGMLGIRAYGSIYSSTIKAIGGIGKVVAEGIFGKGGGEAPKFVDVYLKGHIKDGPLVTRRQQVKGFVVFKDGSKLERSSDIHEPVYDISTDPPSILVTEEQIKHGLCDVNGNPLGTSTPGREGLLGKMFNLGGTIAKGIFGKTGLKIVGGALSGLGAMYKGIFDAILGGGSAVGRGIANIGARLFGFDNPNGFGRKAFTGLNTRLDALIRVAESIRDITADIRDNGGGSGGGGEGGSGGGSGGPGPKGPKGGRGRRRTRRTTRRSAAPGGDSISEEMETLSSADPFDTTPEELARAKKRKAALKKAASSAGRWVANTRLGKWVAGTKLGQGVAKKYRSAADYVKSLREDGEESAGDKKTRGRKSSAAGTGRSGGSSKYIAEARKGKAAATAGRGKVAKDEHVETSWATEEEVTEGNWWDDISPIDLYFYYQMLPESAKRGIRNARNFIKAVRKGAWRGLKGGVKGAWYGKGFKGKLTGFGHGIRRGAARGYRQTRAELKAAEKASKLGTFIRETAGKGFRAAKAVVTAPVKAAQAVGRAATAAKTTYQAKRAAELAKAAKTARAARAAKTATRASRAARGARAGTRAAKAGKLMRGGGRFGRILRPLAAAATAGAGALFAKNAVQGATGAAETIGGLTPEAMKALEKNAARAAGRSAAKGTEKVAQETVEAATRGGTKAAEVGASKGGSWWTRIFGGADDAAKVGVEKAGEKALEKGAEKAAEAGAAQSGSWLSRLFGSKATEKAVEKGAEKATAKGVEKAAEKGGGSAAGNAFALLDFLIAGADANEARKDENTNAIFGNDPFDNPTWHQKEVAGGQAAQNSITSGVMFGLDHLILGDSINNKLGDWIYDDRNAKEKASAEIDKLWGADKYTIGTELRSKLGDHGGWDYVNPLVWGANIIDGASNTADRLHKDIIGTVVGAGSAAWQQSKNVLNIRDMILKKFEEHPELKKTKEGKAAMNAMMLGSADLMLAADTALTKLIVSNANKSNSDRIKKWMSSFAPEMSGVVYDKKSMDGKPIVGNTDLQKLVTWCKNDNPEFKEAYDSWRRAAKGKQGDEYAPWYEDEKMSKLFSTWYTANVGKTFHVKADKSWKYVAKGPDPNKKPGTEKAKEAAKETAAEKPVTNAGTGAAAASEFVAAKTEPKSDSKFAGSDYGEGPIDYNAIAQQAVEKFGGPITVSSLGISKFKEKFSDYVESLPEYENLSLEKQDEVDDRIGDLANKIYADCKKAASPVKDKVEAAMEGKPLDTDSSGGVSEKVSSSRTYKVGEASGAKFSEESYGKGVLDYDKIVKDAVKKFGGPVAVSSLGLPQFRNKLEDYVESLPEYQKLDDDKQDHVDHQLSTLASKAYSDCKTEAGPVRDKVAAVMASPDGKVPAKDTGKPEAGAASGDTVSKSVETAASSTPSPVKDKAEGKTEKKPKSGSPITPADRTKVMKRLSKLIPEIKECMMDNDLARINTYFEVEKIKQESIDKRIDKIHEEMLQTFVLSYGNGWSQSGDTDRKEFVSHGIKNAITEEIDYGVRFRIACRSCAMSIASYLHSTLKGSWSKEFERLFLDKYQGSSPGSLADRVWKKFHGGKGIEESLPENFKKDYDEARSKNSAIDTEAERMDDEVRKLRKTQNDEYDSKYKEFMKSKGYDGWDGMDFYERGMEADWNKLQAEWKKTGNKKESWEDIVKAHPELDSAAYKKANPYTKIPRLSDAKYDEAFKSEQPSAESSSVLGKALGARQRFIDKIVDGTKPYGSYDPSNPEHKEQTRRWVEAATGNPLALVQAIKHAKPEDSLWHKLAPTPDETLLTPPQKPKDLVSPIDLRSTAEVAQNNRVDRVVGALKPAAQVGPTIAAAQEQNSNQLQAVVDSNNELSSLLRSALGGDGLRVAGMDTLIGVTASGSGSGGGQQPQIINNNYGGAQEDTGEGIDLRKKQL